MAIPASSLCISRRLYKISSLQAVSSTRVEVSSLSSKVDPTANGMTATPRHDRRPIHCGRATYLANDIA